MVIGVRKDLKLSKGKTAVQVAHAAVLCSIEASKHRKLLFTPWFREGQKKVVVKLQDIEELFRIRDEGIRQGLVVQVVRDAGLTEIPPGTVTCVGLGPAKNEILDKITGKFTLM